MTGSVAIVTPVLNDWVSFGCLLDEIGSRADLTGFAFHVIAVDDGSATGFAPDPSPIRPGGAIRSVSIIHLAVNLGHQRAIAVGLSVIAERGDIDTVVVMDSDGEDRPEDIAMLLAEAARAPGMAVLARRTRRTETVGFKIGYALYKTGFRLLTGQTIDFGNFSVLPMATVRRLVRMPDVWNNLPAAILRSRIGVTAVPLPRGRRYAGESRMNMPGLIVHGLSAMSVFSEVIFVRVLLTALAVALVTVLLMLVVVGIKFLTNMAIPGWATTAFGDLTIVLTQIVVTVVATTFVVLSSRIRRPIVPASDAQSFIVSQETIYRRDLP